MEGFFTKKESESTSRPDGKTYSCVSCGLYKDCKSPKMKASGGFQKGILNIGTMPTKIEDRRGNFFQNKAGKLLKKTYANLGIDLFEDCLNINAINCMSEDTPTTYQIDCCRKFILRAIKKHKPKVIVLLGDSALYSIIGHRWKKELGTIQKWRGWKIPDQEMNAWIVPTLSIESVLDEQESKFKTKFENTIWIQDLQKVIECLDTPLLQYNEPEIITLTDLNVLNEIKSGSTIAFDYETTGLKPHAKGHRIICISVAISEDKVYTFMLPKNRNKRKPFTELLQRKDVYKIAQNMKFEDTWTTIRLKVPVNNWLWDTMLATHTIDNRTGVTSLKFQTYVQFGIIDYDSEVAPYLKAVDNKNANSINRIEELIENPGGEKLLLQYCGYDSIYEYRLAMVQRKLIAQDSDSVLTMDHSNYSEGYHLLHNGILALAKAERQGLRIDVEYCVNKTKRLTKKISRLENKIFESKFYRHWQHSTRGHVNLNSGNSLGNFLYNVKKLKPAKLTTTGKGSTDEEALKMLNIPELNWLLERSKLKTLIDKLDGFSREQVNGYLHPFYNLHLAKTYRSSSSNPNFQNIHKRDKVAMKTVRKAIYPRPGNQLMELDYKGIEVSIAACYHKDPNMIKYITDPTSDMHGDMAVQIFMIDDWDKSRSDHEHIRNCVKNSFVFPQFYGDYYKNNAIDICGNWMGLPQSRWNSKMGYELENGKTIADHLIKKGIRSFDAFVEHIQVIEKDFWTNRFPGYAKWKEEHYSQYLKDGYVSLKTGFTCGGVMSKNDVINYPVQGSAFHCLLWTLIETSKALEKGGFGTKIVGQIHDALILDTVPKEKYEVYNLVKQIGTIDLVKKFKWINVPLTIDAEICPVDASWADKEKWKPEDDPPF